MKVDVSEPTKNVIDKNYIERNGDGYTFVKYSCSLKTKYLINLAVVT